MPVTVDGIVSGIDTTSMINAILTAQSVPIETMKSHLATFEKQREAVAGIKSRLVNVSDILKKMNTPSTLVSHKATTASSQYAVTASEGASEGTYDVRVMNLATAQKSTSDGWDDKAAHVFGTGTMSVTVGGTTTDITVDSSNNTLEGLAAAINDVSGMSAFVIDTGVSTGRYKLLVQGAETGAANGFSIDTSGLAGGFVPAFTVSTSAVDALVRIGGVDVHVASNTLDGAIPGIRIDLLQPGTTEDPFTVERDQEALRAKMQEMVDAYNELVDYYDVQTVYNPEQNIKGPLIGDSTTRRAVDDVGTLFTDAYVIPGVDLSSLAELGISTGRDGKLEFDADAFDSAFEEDPDAAVAFLTSDDGPLTTIATRIDDLYVDPETGTLVTREESLDATIEDQNDAIAAAEERMAGYAQILRDQFTAMEVALANIQASQSYISALLVSSTTTTTG